MTGPCFRVGCLSGRLAINNTAVRDNWSFGKPLAPTHISRIYHHIWCLQGSKRTWISTPCTEQNIWWNEDSATMEQLKISQVQNIITKKHISEYTCSKGKSKTLGYNHIISGVCKIAYLYL